MNSPFERLWPTIEQEKRGTLINWFPLDYIMYRIHEFSQEKSFSFIISSLFIFIECHIQEPKKENEELYEEWKKNYGIT